jgi:salicylate hydroxylase
MSRSPQPLDVVIAGAGLGGLAAAIALRRVGHTVVVLEQSPTLGTVGAGIQFATNAARLLRAWGVVDRVGDQAVGAQAAIRRRWADGSVLGSVEIGAAAREYAEEYLCAHRADFHRALVDTATDQEGPGTPVTIELGVPVTGVEPDGHKAIVHYGDAQTIEADFAVGADGIRSAVRDALFGPQPTSFSGQVTNRMIVDVASLPDDPFLAALAARPAQNIWIGPGGHAITHPVRGTAQFYVGVTRDRGLARDEAFWSQRLTIQGVLDELEGWDPHLRAIVAAAAEVTSYGLHDSDPMDRWGIGRATLLGDACHAMLPFQAQGAAQAIEDGAVLANCLVDVRSADAAEALRRYEAKRQPRTARVQAASRANGGAWHLPDGPEQRARDAALAQGEADFRSYEWLWAVGDDAAPTATILN